MEPPNRSSGQGISQVENGFSGVVLDRHMVSKPDASAEATQTFVLGCLTGKFALLKASKVKKHKHNIRLSPVFLLNYPLNKKFCNTSDLQTQSPRPSAGKAQDPLLQGIFSPICGSAGSPLPGCSHPYSSSGRRRNCPPFTWQELLPRPQCPHLQGKGTLLYPANTFPFLHLAESGLLTG